MREILVKKLKIEKFYKSMNINNHINNTNSSQSDITMIILTFNEEAHIGRCINSVKDVVREIIIIDSYSSDNTLKICKKLNVRVYQNKFISYGKQVNWVLKNINIKSKWIFRIDADEYVQKNSLTKITDIISNKKNISGIIIQRKIKFLNKIINYGLTSPHNTLRIWKTGKGIYPDIDTVDDQVEVKGSIYLSKAIIIDHNLKSFSDWLTKHRNYAIREGNSYYKEKINNKLLNKDLSKINKFKKFNIYYKLPIFIRPFILFVYSYFFKLGFLSGWQGLVFNFFQILWFRFLVDMEIFRLSKKNKA